MANLKKIPKPIPTDLNNFAKLTKPSNSLKTKSSKNRKPSPQSIAPKSVKSFSNLSQPYSLKKLETNSDSKSSWKKKPIRRSLRLVGALLIA